MRRAHIPHSIPGGPSQTTSGSATGTSSLACCGGTPGRGWASRPTAPGTETCSCGQWTTTGSR
eukprot:4073881-Lingulodinium_polyedra.AAC.1